MSNDMTVSCKKEFDQVIASDLPEIEKLAQAYGCITGFIVDYAHKEIELAKAMQDRESMIKQQIKMETMKSARGIFETCYRRVTGRKVWDE